MRELFCTIQMVSRMKSFAALERRSTHLLITPPILYSTANKYYVYIYIYIIHLFDEVPRGRDEHNLSAFQGQTYIDRVKPMDIH